MHKSIVALALLVLVFSAPELSSQPITVRVSVKVVLDANDERPADGLLSTNEQIRAAFDVANRILSFNDASWWLSVTEIEEISGAEEWFGPTGCGDVHGRNSMQNAARRDPAYLWRDNAVNFYVIDDFRECSAVCSFPSAGDDIIVMESQLDDRIRSNSDFAVPTDNYEFVAGFVMLHELGHYFQLCHTQGCVCGPCDEAQIGGCHTQPADDWVEDTLPDLHCWSADDIAAHSFDRPYDELDDEERLSVDRAIYNVMSYHWDAFLFSQPFGYLTEGQLRRAARELHPTTGRRREVVALDCAALDRDCDRFGLASYCGLDLPSECPSPPVEFRRGDANDDSFFDISDGVAILNAIFLGTVTLDCLDAADANDSDAVDISDGIAVFRYLFVGDAPPPPPFETCGEDSEEGPGCEAFTGC